MILLRYLNDNKNIKYDNKDVYEIVLMLAGASRILGNFSTGKPSKINMALQSAEIIREITELEQKIIARWEFRKNGLEKAPTVQN